MAILNSCCCCRSVRRGSYACALYSMVYYAVLAGSLWMFLRHKTGQQKGGHESVIVSEEQYQEHSPVIDQLGMVMFTLSLAGPVTCILLIIGLCKDIKVLLLPWLVDAVLIILLDLVFVAYIVYQEHMKVNPVVALTYTFDFFLMVLNIYAVLCVTSQYQEYRSGRGRAEDDGSTSPPCVRYTRQSTLNSGIDSARRTVTFLEQGVTLNGISPSHTSVTVTAARSLTISFKDDPSTHNLHSSGNNLCENKIMRNGKKHVQFPTFSPVSEWEPPGIEEDDVTTFADHKDAETSKDIRVMDAASPQKPSGRTSPIPEEPSDGAASPSPKEDSDTSSPSSKGTASSSSSKDDGKAIEEKEEREGPEADPLLAPESPERGEEAL
ncbi:uncharacterized protein LOC119579760 [Penaeus monodon]|uniref:uncharacterized protein LOC119579760 n=1 Tax=Penaeus monodon TaxID=6687 RepID=UPI0018A7C9CB|nr:uncharacterized protein LOC119579760 [Penaeus monodon]